MTELSELAGDRSDAQEGERIHGVVVGTVKNNDDPEKLGRVQVWFARISESGASHWARVAAAMAGPDCGAYFVPAVDDEVLVAFENGHIDRPIVIGSLWNGVDVPPKEGTDGHPDVRVIKSRSGHTIVLDDAAGAEKVEIRTRGGHTILLDDTAGAEKIEIRGSDGECSVVLDGADGSINLTPGGGGQVRIGGESAAKVLALHDEVVDMLSDVQMMFTALSTAWAALPCASPLWNTEGPAIKAIWAGAVTSSLVSFNVKLAAYMGSAKGRST